jgi:hypothetical protein
MRIMKTAYGRVLATRKTARALAGHIESLNKIIDAQDGERIRLASFRNSVLAAERRFQEKEEDARRVRQEREPASESQS